MRCGKLRVILDRTRLRKNFPSSKSPKTVSSHFWSHQCSTKTVQFISKLALVHVCVGYNTSLLQPRRLSEGHRAHARRQMWQVCFLSECKTTRKELTIVARKVSEVNSMITRRLHWFQDHKSNILRYTSTIDLGRRSTDVAAQQKFGDILPVNPGPSSYVFFLSDHVESKSPRSLQCIDWFSAKLPCPMSSFACLILYIFVKFYRGVLIS